jgi:uncharacterized protein
LTFLDAHLDIHSGAGSSTAHAAGSCRLLLFVRYPQAGKTKTRLIPALGKVGAAKLQRQMAEYLLCRVQQPNWQLQIHFTGGTRSEMADWLGTGLMYCPQVGESLGDRLRYAFQQESQHRVVAIGADCVDLSADHIHQAFQALIHHDVVLGPAQDGGYYLIGLRRFHPPLGALFEGIDWSTSRVLQQTQAKIRQLGRSLAQIETLSDIDRPQDLAIWERIQRASGL